MPPIFPELPVPCYTIAKSGDNLWKAHSATRPIFAPPNVCLQILLKDSVVLDILALLDLIVPADIDVPRVLAAQTALIVHGDTEDHNELALAALAAGSYNQERKS